MDEIGRQETLERGFTRLEVLLTLVILALGLTLLSPSHDRLSDRAPQMIASSHAKQLMMALIVYAADHAGEYPDGKTANEVLRELVKVGVIDEEQIFGAPQSPFVPDGEVGKPPSFDEAGAVDEVHWMMIGGTNVSTAGNEVVLFENTVDATWPPSWDSSQEGLAVRGRTWNSGKVVVARRDGTVSIPKAVGPNPKRRTLPEWLNAPPKPVLDIEVSGDGF